MTTSPGTTTELMSIGDVAVRTGLTVHTLRYYENIGLLHHVARDAGGRRQFTVDDLGWIDLLTKLRRTGMPIATMVRYAELVRAGDPTLSERIELLETHRELMLRQRTELDACLAVVDYKINLYRGAEKS